MKIAFISHSFESLGLEALSAILKGAGHETALFYDPALFDDTIIFNASLSRIFSERGGVIRRLSLWEPDLVCISVLSDTYLWGLDMARRVKRAWPVPVAMGGMHATSVPEVVIGSPHVDYVVQGEGDGAIIDLVNHIENDADLSGVPNLWSKSSGEIIGNAPRPLIRDLDNLPFPDKSLYDHTFFNGLAIYNIMASRGCPYQCTYCGEGILREIYSQEKGSMCRSRGVDNVIEELKWADGEGRVGVVHFFDDVFGADIRWLREFAPKYRREIGKPFWAMTHPGHCSEEYVELVKEAGCIKIDLGVQSTDPHIRKNVLNRYETNNQIANAIDRFMKSGVPLYVDNIFNLPGQDEDITREMVRFYNKHRPTVIKAYGLSIYPRTPIERIALEKGLITEDCVKRNARGDTSSLSSPILGGSLGDRSLFRFQALLSIMPLLPPQWVDFILDRRLYRYLPHSRYGTTIGRIVQGRNWEEDVMMRSIAIRYLRHTGGFFKKQVMGRKRGRH